MITEDYVSFETAKLLQDKNFYESAIAYYDISNFEPSFKMGTTYLNHNFKYSAIPLRFSAPTLQMAMKWLRKEHNLAISTSITIDGWRSYISQIKLDSEGFVVDIIDGIDEGNIPNCDTYEKACEAAIKYCLENLI